MLFGKINVINSIKLYSKQILNKDFGEIGLRLIRFDGKNGIIKCHHIQKDNVIKLLKSIKNISSHEVIIKTIGTSGTIKKLIQKHMINKIIFY